MTVTGFDSCDAALAQAQAAGSYQGLSYMRWDIVADPIPAELGPGQFDIVTCRYGLQSLEPGRLLTDVGRWLKPNGIFYALVRVDPGHGPADRHPRTDLGEQFTEVSPFSVTDEYVRRLGVGWAYRAVHELGPHRRVIVLSEYGADGGRCLTPQPAALVGERFRPVLHP